MPNRKREVISQQYEEIGDGIIKKDGGTIKKDDEVIGDQHLADEWKCPCFKCDRLKPAHKGARFFNFEQKENDTPVNTADETLQKFNYLKAAKRKDRMASKLEDRSSWEKER